MSWCPGVVLPLPLSLLLLLLHLQDWYLPPRQAWVPTAPPEQAHARDVPSS